MEVRDRESNMLNSAGLSPDTSDLENSLMDKDSPYGKKALLKQESERNTARALVDGAD